MAHRFYIPEDKINLKEKLAVIEGDEFAHAAKTLRLKPQAEVEIFDGQGGLYQGVIASREGKTYKINVLKYVQEKLDYELDVLIAAPKGKKIDLIVKALAEVGVTKISIFQSRYTIAKSSEEKASRLNRIAVEACKQSKRLYVPSIMTGLRFDDVLEQVKKADKSVVFYEKAKSFIDPHELNSKNISLVIGSEGGFAEDEIELLEEAGASSSLLSDAVLRTETAAITASHLARYSQLRWDEKCKMNNEK